MRVSFSWMDSYFHHVTWNLLCEERRLGRIQKGDNEKKENKRKIPAQKNHLLNGNEIGLEAHG